jgi:archaeal type IV pilus assembly protein PilA
MKAIIRKDEQAVSPVIATILMVAITVVLAAVLYVMVSGLLTGPGPSKPLVTFGSPSKVNAVTWTITIAGAQPSIASSNYKINFGIGTATGTAVNMGSSGTNVTVTVTGGSPASVGVKWTNLGGQGTVTAGDIMTIAFPSAPTTGTSLTLYLLYSDGSQIQKATWTA